MLNGGYFRAPSIRGNTIVFVSEDDLWTVPRDGGVARRLTANLGPVGRAAISPDGELIAFTGSEEHHPEVYCMPSSGGASRRLTHFGSNTSVRGWTRDGRIIFVSDRGQPFAGLFHAYSIDPDGTASELIGFGPAHDVSYGPDGGVVLGRHTVDPARWKRYKGGTRGDLWVDAKDTGTFRRLVELDGNLASPMWIGRRIHFISDHEGVGNIYSVRPDGRDLQRHTDHDRYYARFAATDGTRIAYQHAAELWTYDPQTDEARRVEVEFRSPRIRRNRKFVETSKFMTDAALHPEGHSVVLDTRGKLFTMPLWEQAPRQHGKRDGVRYRLGRWMSDGRTVVAVSDDGGEEAIEVHSPDDRVHKRLDGLDLGRVLRMSASPTRNQVALSNHRLELILVDLDSGRSKVLDSSRYGSIHGFSWSPDGRYLAYGFQPTSQSSQIRMVEVDRGKVHEVTRPDFIDMSPSFDPEGRYLYFLSYRTFDPVYDSLYFDLGFPRAVRPYAVTLRPDVASPFRAEPRGFGEAKKDDEPAGSSNGKGKSSGNGKPQPLQVDFNGIADRVVAFPVPVGRYGQIRGIKGKVLFTNQPVEGSLGRETFTPDDEPRASLEMFDLKEQRHEVLVGGVSGFTVSRDNSTVMYSSGKKLRVLKAGEKPKDDNKDKSQDKERAGRKSGWLDLNRIKVSVDPASEYRQMFRESWRLQKDHFWVPDLSGVDWPEVHDRYLPLVEKVSTRAEFSDLMWETLGELGTSHAYEIGGDYIPPPPYSSGYLGADLVLDRKSGRWTFSHIVRGDTWDPTRDSPLREPGVNVSEGDTLLAVGGQDVSAEVSPHSLLVNQAGTDVELVVGDAKGRKPRTVFVKTLRAETPARYREWVEMNRARVHEETGGRVGYVHIPNMGPLGYSEFHRYYLQEVERDGLIVDVRFNGGGHVSQLILEKLGRRRIGYAVPRWGAAEPYPGHSPTGPLVCLTNERAGSDGDIFTHAFKLMGLGPVVGKRTWGGVVGISGRHTLVDGGMTTQPEYSYWFADVSWGVENYGTDPDYDVDIKPQDYAEGRDPQMDKALQLIMKAVKSHSSTGPDLDNRPSRALPVLPPRGGGGEGEVPRAEEIKKAAVKRASKAKAKTQR
ncbi:MAG TPA: S41 family peptidase [Actinomycetota bacterium]|nr:S41 family peptidase [Actinomycetota bacterium]